MVAAHDVSTCGMYICVSKSRNLSCRLGQGQSASSLVFTVLSVQDTTDIICLQARATQHKVSQIGHHYPHRYHDYQPSRLRQIRIALVTSVSSHTPKKSCPVAARTWVDIIVPETTHFLH